MKKKQKPKLFNKEYQKQWSEEYKYKHIHTGEYCTFEAYLAEYLILRWADAFKMDKPSYKFWTKGDRYHDAFIRNMKATQSLKKKYDPETILAAVRSDHFKNIYHIGLKAYGPRGWKYNQVALEAIKSYHKEEKSLAQHTKEAKQAQDFLPPDETPKENIARRKNSAPIKQKSIFNKLRNI